MDRPGRELERARGAVKDLDGLDGLDWIDRLDTLGADRDLDTWDREEAADREALPLEPPMEVILWENVAEDRKKTSPVTRAVKIRITLDGQYRLMTQLL